MIHVPGLGTFPASQLGLTPQQLRSLLGGRNAPPGPPPDKEWEGLDKMPVSRAAGAARPARPPSRCSWHPAYTSTTPRLPPPAGRDPGCSARAAGHAA
jgi:hypothetical protein